MDYKKLVEKWADEFEEKGTVLVKAPHEIVDWVEKELISRDLWYERELDNGYIRFVKSDTRPY
ncbi:hypothetical protein [Bacillus atrophaeus]|nr:hypothetical protein [Bacillus atrophaeus]MEC0747005.1 hypothetical protein [Bacillus atrophaeus]MEC0760471.1 hypothetical protein [Bacillus atrophaeus]MEC0963050.1 hypothetical protein [Bacillus atrophaeus]